MQDNKKIVDDTRSITSIDVNSASSINYWMRVFNCSSQQLRDAVAKSGNSSAAVSQEIRLLKSNFNNFTH